MTIKLKGSTDGSVSLSAPADTSPTGTDITLTLPTDAGSANQFLKNSGTAGTLDYSSMVEDSSGRVGISTTPGNFDVDADDLVVGDGTGNSGITVYSGSGSLSSLYFADGTSTAAEKYAGGMNYSHTANQLAFFTNGGQTRMRIDSAGLVMIGTATEGYANGADNLTIEDTGNCGITIRSTSSTAGSIYFSDATSGAGEYAGYIEYSHNTNTMRFATSSAEKIRIDSTGYFLSSVSGSFYGAGNNFHSFDQGTNAAQWTLGLRNSHASQPFGLVINYSGYTPNNTSNQFLYCNDTTSLKLAVKSNGGIENYQANNTNLCDEREKKNIETLDSTWGCLKNWELKKFHYNEDADTDDKRYGVIAQQVEQHCPELISDWTKQRAEEAVLDEDGNVVTPAKEEILRKGVKEQQMMWMAIKALQEAQERIETLETKVAALEAV